MTAASNSILSPSFALKKSLRELNHASNSLGLDPNSMAVEGYDHEMLISSDLSMTRTSAVQPALSYYQSQFSAGSEAAAHRLLAQSGINSAQIARDSRNLDNMLIDSSSSSTFNLDSTYSSSLAPYPNLLSLRSNDETKTSSNLLLTSDDAAKATAAAQAAMTGSLDEFLHENHIQLVNSILKRHREKTQSDIDEFIQNRLIQDWENRKKQALLCSTLIHSRALSGIGATLESSFDTGGTRIPADSRINLPYSARNKAPDALVWNEVEFIQTPVGKDQSDANIDSNHANDPSSIMMDADEEIHYIALRSKIAAYHLNLLLSSENSSDLLSLQSLVAMIERLQLDTCSNDGDGTMHVQEKVRLKSYLDAAKLLEKMFRCESFLSVGSNSAAGRSGYAGISKERKIFLRTMGALDYLGDQFRDYLFDRVTKSASNLSGKGFGKASGRYLDGTKGDESIASLVKRYVELEIGRDVVARGGNSVLYRCLYYCLRCGDGSAAKEVLDSYIDVDPTVRNIVMMLSNSQSDMSSQGIAAAHEFTPPLKGLMLIPVKLREDAAGLYRRIKAQFSANSQIASAPDEYQLACLALLSLDESLLNSGTKSVIKTIEDYMFATLWYAVNAHDGENGQTDRQGHLCTAEVAQLGANVKRWGSDYFEGEIGWAFAMPLLLSQQFRFAMIHLANVAHEGLCVSTHLSLGIAHVNADIDDLDDNDSGMSDSHLLPSLLVAYSDIFQRLSPRGALRYLVCLRVIKVTDGPKTTDAKKPQLKLVEIYPRIIRLILLSKAYEALVGHVAVDGSRRAASGIGGLDKYFSRSEVSTILEIAAEETFHDGNIADSAELLMLAERYSSLLSLLIRQLSSSLALDSIDTNKQQFWKIAAQHFYSIYLDKGRTYVVQVLEKEGKIALKKSLGMLLQICELFYFYQDGRWQNAWEVIERLDLFPRSESELTLKVTAYHGLDDEIKDLFHRVVLYSMDALYQDYVKLKSFFAGDGSVSNVSAVQQRLLEIRRSAKLLVTYSGLIQYRDINDTKARLNRMEACML